MGTSHLASIKTLASDTSRRVINIHYTCNEYLDTGINVNMVKNNKVSLLLIDCYVQCVQIAKCKTNGNLIKEDTFNHRRACFWYRACFGNMHVNVLNLKYSANWA